MAAINRFYGLWFINVEYPYLPILRSSHNDIIWLVGSHNRTNHTVVGYLLLEEEGLHLSSQGPGNLPNVDILILQPACDNFGTWFINNCSCYFGFVWGESVLEFTSFNVVNVQFFIVATWQDVGVILQINDGCNCSPMILKLLHLLHLLHVPDDHTATAVIWARNQELFSMDIHDG